MSGIGLLLVVAAGMLTPYVSVEAGLVAAGGVVALALLEGFAFVDKCGECDEQVDVKTDHYCSACGESLSAVPYRPADLEDADDGRAAA